MQHQLLKEDRTAISEPSNASVIYGRLCFLKSYYQVRNCRIFCGQVFAVYFPYGLVHVFVFYRYTKEPKECGRYVWPALKPLKNTGFRKIAKLFIISHWKNSPISVDAYLLRMLSTNLSTFLRPEIAQFYKRISENIPARVLLSSSLYSYACKTVDFIMKIPKSDFRWVRALMKRSAFLQSPFPNW